MVLTVGLGGFLLIHVLGMAPVGSGNYPAAGANGETGSGTDGKNLAQQKLLRDAELYRQRSLQLEKLLMIRSKRGEGKYKMAFLTFDDGPSANTGKVLDILSSYNIKGTFFVIGNDTEQGRALYRRIVDEGHALGNHTFTHDYSSIYRSTDSFWKDFSRLEELLFDATGTRPRLMRFPGGSNNQVSRKAGGRGIMKVIAADMSSKGYSYVDWDIESGDASRVFRSGNYLYNRVIGNLEYYDSAVILFHDTKRNTPLLDALPRIIEEMLARGYVFLPITESWYPEMPRFQP